jgi:hypothetical protein
VSAVQCHTLSSCIADLDGTCKAHPSSAVAITEMAGFEVHPNPVLSFYHTLSLLHADSSPEIQSVQANLGCLLQNYAFKMLPVASMSHRAMEFCPGSNEPASSTLVQTSPNVKLLITIGIQKGGTTWFHRALDTHPAFIRGLTTVPYVLCTAEYFTHHVHDA